MFTRTTAYGLRPQTAQATVATGTSAAILAADPTNLKRSPTGFTITALPANTVPVYIGGVGVTVANGHILPPGGSHLVYVDDPSKLYAIAGSAAQVISIIY